MRPMKRLIGGLLLVLGLAAGLSEAAQPVRIGILSYRSLPTTAEQWGPTAEWLEAQVPGHDFEIVPLFFPDLEAAVRTGRLQFVLTNPEHFIMLRLRHGLEATATLMTLAGSHPVSKFGGVIYTRADRRDIRGLADLKGKRIAAVDPRSLGGYLTQRWTLHQAGIDITRDAAMFYTGMPHDNTVHEVLAGSVDAGFARTGILEAMAREGKLRLEDIRVLNPQADSAYPLLLSTELYPEWPFAALPNVPEPLVKAVTLALMNLPPDAHAARKGGYYGFSAPGNYGAVDAIMVRLGLHPERQHFGWRDVYERYAGHLLVALSLLLAAAAFTAYRYRIGNRALGEALARADRLALRDVLLNNLGEGVYGVDARGHCTFINPAALSILGYALEEVIGQDQHRVFHHHRPDGSPYPASDCPVRRTLGDGIRRETKDAFIHKNGETVPVQLTVTPILEGRDITGAVVVFQDITERTLMEEELLRLATTDPLTELANRRRLLEQVEDELARVKRYGNAAAMLMLDIDHFKRVNDTYGHAVGDKVLRHFAGLAAQHLRQNDLLGRLGGEEFALLLPGTDLEGAALSAERLRQFVATHPCVTDELTIPITVSIGVAEFSPADQDGDGLMARADEALYRAKQGGRNRVECAK